MALPHARNINGKLYLRIAHNLTKGEAQKKANRERKHPRGSQVRVISEGGKFSVFRRLK
ncbi:MAG TPA: hypothetical protein VMW50_14945 [Dehalococcoidia bacterium]|nr:hypothetical protein [Dehalococcoidia bacterium]